MRIPELNRSYKLSIYKTNKFNHDSLVCEDVFNGQIINLSKEQTQTANRISYDNSTLTLLTTYQNNLYFWTDNNLRFEISDMQDPEFNYSVFGVAKRKIKNKFHHFEIKLRGISGKN